MRLFIKIKDGQPFEHPIIEDNFKQAFPHVDVDNLPAEFMNYVYTPYTSPVSVLKKLVYTYEIVGDLVKTKWDVVNKTEEELNEERQRHRRWRENPEEEFSKSPLDIPFVKL
jgi:hypothetical protein